MSCVSVPTLTAGTDKLSAGGHLWITRASGSLDSLADFEHSFEYHRLGASSQLFRLPHVRA